MFRFLKGGYNLGGNTDLVSLTAPDHNPSLSVIDAAAITQTNSVYFAPGQYSASLNGIELVAHEYAANIKEAIRNQYGERPCEKYKP